MLDWKKGWDAKASAYIFPAIAFKRANGPMEGIPVEMKSGGALNGFARRNPGRGRSSACFLGGDDEWLPAPPQEVMRDGFILLVTVFLSSLAAAAQTLTPQTVPAQKRVAPIITRLQTVHVPSLDRSFVLSEDPGKSAGNFSYLFVRAYEGDQGLQNLSPILRVKTLFLTQSSLPIFQLWGGRLRLDGFTSRLHIPNVQLGSPAVGGPQDLCSPRRYPGGPRSVRFYGLSLSFSFGRDTEIRRPTQPWRCFSRFVSAPR